MTVAQSTTTPINNGHVRWRELDREGCEQGRSLSKDVETLKENYKRLEGRMDRLIWAMVLAAMGLGTSSLMLGLNLALTFVKP